MTNRMRSIYNFAVSAMLVAAAVASAPATGYAYLGFFFPGREAATRVVMDSRTAISDFPTGITVEAWIYVTNPAERQVIVSKRKDAAGGGGYELRLTPAGRINFSTYTNSGSLKASVESAATVRANQWVHVAGGFNASTQRMFAAVDGAWVQSPSPVDGRPAAGSTPLQVGRALLVAGGTNYFSGSIDNLTIWPTARYTTTFTPACWDAEGVRLQMKFDQIFEIGGNWVTPAFGLGYSATAKLQGAGAYQPVQTTGCGCY